MELSGNVWVDFPINRANPYQYTQRYTNNFFSAETKTHPGRMGLQLPYMQCLSTARIFKLVHFETISDNPVLLYRIVP